jgi:hypothetical protein
MENHEYDSIRQMQGSMSQLRCPDPGAFEHAYMRPVKDLQQVLVTGREAWRACAANNCGTLVFCIRQMPRSNA